MGIGGSEADHLPPSSAEVKNAWWYIFLPFTEQCTKICKISIVGVLNPRLPANTDKLRAKTHIRFVCKRNSDLCVSPCESISLRLPYVSTPSDSMRTAMLHFGNDYFQMNKTDMTKNSFFASLFFTSVWCIFVARMVTKNRHEHRKNEKEILLVEP